MEMPEEADTLRKELGWSEPTHAFHGTTGHMGCAYFVTFLFGLPVLGGLGYIVVAYFNNPRNFANMAGMALTVISIPALFFAALLSMVLYYRDRRAYVYDEGLVFLSANKKYVCPWQQITQVWQNLTVATVAGIQTSSAGSMIVQLENGVTWSVDSHTMAGAIDLMTIVQDNVTKRLLPEAKRKFAANEVLPFGNVEISRAGIAFYAKSLVWSDVQRVCVLNGYFVVEQRGAWSTWCSLPVKQIPNLVVFLSLVDSVRRIG